jgi:hypothetical protein
MAITPATPIAVTLPPSNSPLQFTELINFRGDFDQVVGPGEPVNPKGIVYHPGLDRLLVSLSPYRTASGSRSQILNALTLNGTRSAFAPGYQMFRAVESKIAVAPDSGPPVSAGFTPGEIFLGRGPNAEISRLSPTGEVLADVWAEFVSAGGLWGGICFDTEGDFGGRLIAIDSLGKIYLFNADGSSTLLADTGFRLEGVAVAPSTFGPYAKQMIVGVEGYDDDDPHGGEVYAISNTGEQTLLANIGYAAEDIRFVPPRGGAYFQTQLCFDSERENRVFKVSSSQFLNRRGRMIVVNEMVGELWEVAWDGSRYTQQQVGVVPGRWSSAGFNVQGTELESGCFAVKTPRIPNWTDWQLVDNIFTSDQAPAATTDAFGQVALFTKGRQDSQIYYNSTQNEALQIVPPNSPGDPIGGRGWSGWQPEPASPKTVFAPACANHNLRTYTFAVKPDGGILHKYMAPGDTGLTAQTWDDVPGGFQTRAGCGCATVNGRLVLCAINNNSEIYLNELAPGGRSWGGWYQIPGGGHTDVTPTVVGFQDELYVFVKGLTSKRILLKARSVDGVWTEWAEIPGPGLTDAPITAIAADGQLYVFVKGVDNRPYVNISSETGVWTGWTILPNPGLTDVGMAAAAIQNNGSRVLLFAKGIDDRRLYVRSTAG